MPVNRDGYGAKHRFIVLMYLSCFILSLAPTIVAPPEKGFSQGQPEMDQAMDNMVSHGILIKKTGHKFAAGSAIDYPALLTSKTTKLLDDAEQALSTLQSPKEKQWVEDFVQRMRAIAMMLDRTTEGSNQTLPMNLNFVSGMPVPEGLPSQPATAVRVINPVQKPKNMMSKSPVTSAELSKVLSDNKYPSERQAVVKPAMMSKNQEYDEDDELVRELKSLHQKVVSEVPAQNSKVILPTTDITIPATPEYPESVSSNTNDVEMKKTKLKEKLLEEISMFQNLGGEIPKELVSAISGENKTTTGFEKKPKAQTSKLVANNGGMFDPIGIEGIDIITDENKQISKANSEILDVEKKNDLQLKENRTFQNINLNLNLNLPAFRDLDGHITYATSLSKERTYGIENFQKPNPFNFHANYRVNPQQNHIPNAFRQRMLRQGNGMYNGYLPGVNYNGYPPKPRYRPYPYSQNWNHSNSTVDFRPDMSPYVMKPSMNRQIDTQLNDEMKRQLRDGKIVVLSDSVVRSNFGTKEEEKANEKERNQPKIDVNVNKNDSKTPN